MVLCFTLKRDRADGLILVVGEDNNGGGSGGGCGEDEDGCNIKELNYRFRQVWYKTVCNVMYTYEKGTRLKVFFWNLIL